MVQLRNFYSYTQFQHPSVINYLCVSKSKRQIKKFKNQLKPQKKKKKKKRKEKKKNEHTAGCLSFQIKYKSKRHYDMFRVSKIAKSSFK